MEIKDLSWNQHLDRRNNHCLLPHSIRGVIIGKSGCGKSTLLMNLLLQPDWLDYDWLYCFGKSLFQPEYQIIRAGFENHVPKDTMINLFQNRSLLKHKDIDPADFIRMMADNLRDDDKSDISCEFYQTSEEVPDPSDLDSSRKNLMIFDDLQLEKQSTPEKYFVRGRHSNVDCFYIGQNYFKLPRQTIRENANLYLIFKQDKKNLNHIYSDHVAGDMSKELFVDFCNKAWSEKHGFICIDLSSGPMDGRYRVGLDKFFIPC